MLTIVKGTGRNSGFTLMEVLVVMLIISVLVVIGLPNFNDYLRKGRRPDGKAILLDIADKQEMFYTANVPNSYSNTLAGLGYPANPQPSEQGYYLVSLVEIPGGCAPATATPCTGFALTATAQGAQASDGCGNLTLNNFGVKGRTGTLAVSSCW